DNNSTVQAKGRLHAGAHFETTYSDFAVGDLFVGYARDKSWRRFLDKDNDPATPPEEEHRFDRLLLEGTLLFPRASIGAFAPAPRFSVDKPVNGNETAEVRMSVLLYYPLNNWLDRFKPSVKSAKESK